MKLKDYIQAEKLYQLRLKQQDEEMEKLKVDVQERIFTFKEVLKKKHEKELTVLLNRIQRDKN